MKRALIILIWIAATTGAFAQNGNDVNLFLDGLRLSYDGDHEGAKQKFQEYQKSHPSDLLAPLRMFYDHFFDVHNQKMNAKEYQTFLAEVNAAVGIFETKRCSGTDLSGIGHGTLDCDYVGAALYSFREVLRIKNEGVLKTGQADDKKFFAFARRSNSAQASFLLGVHEYELSNRVFPVRWLLRAKGISSDRGEALRSIVASFTDESPFADDIWFFIFRLENQRRPGFERFIKDYPLDGLRKELEQKYPHNQAFRSSSDSLEDVNTDPEPQH